MKHLTIQHLIDDTHEEIRTLVRKMEAADALGNHKRYIEYADSIVEKINEIKALKRRLKFYNFIGKMKKAILPLFFIIFFISCNGYDRTDQDDSSDYDKICIEGHVYFKRVMGNLSFLGIKLTDDGKPIKCEDYKKTTKGDI